VSVKVAGRGRKSGGQVGGVVQEPAGAKEEEGWEREAVEEFDTPVEEFDAPGSSGYGSGESGLFDFLVRNEFFIERDLADLIETVLESSKRKAFLLRGPAGVGKTQLTYLIARYLDAEYVFFQCTTGTSEDDLLYKYIPSEETKSGIKVTYGPIPRALALSKTKKVVLVLDEFDKTRPSADALLLDVLQNFRVSLYLDEDETVVQGNPENLIIILTSNDMREFSEPLLRRLASIELKPLPPEMIFELLSKRFGREIAALLTQIYSDTINAELRKPATIQELYQLGEVLERGVNMPLEKLLRIFIVKYDDDWKKFVNYVSSRKPYSFKSGSKKEASELAKYYEPQAEVEFEREEDEGEEEKEVATLLEKLRKLAVKTEGFEAKPEKVSQEEPVLVTLKVADRDFDAYTEVIKTLQPPASDDPAKFGKFEFVESEITAIISREPLTIKEAFELAINGNISEIEGYYEGVIYTDNINELINDATKIKYYTAEKVFLEYIDDDAEEKVLIEKVSDISYRVKGYFKRTKQNATLPLLTHANQYASERGRLIELLLKPRNKVVIEDENPTLWEFRKDVEPKELVTLIENLRRSSIADKVRLVISRSNPNYSLTSGYRKIMLWWKIGEALYKRFGEVDISLADEKVSEIVEAIRAMG